MWARAVRDQTCTEICVCKIVVSCSIHYRGIVLPPSASSVEQVRGRGPPRGK